MPSPLRLPHGRWTRRLSGLLWLYEDATPGVDGADNATTILGDESEPQPDLFLRLLPECGGQSTEDSKQYLIGAPELVIEVAHSSEAIDLHAKKDDYENAGVIEYVVFCVEEMEVRAFDLRTKRRWAWGDDHIFRSQVFPGLWIDTRAFFLRGSSSLKKTALKGLRSPEHAAFVTRMKAMLAAKKGRKRR